MPVITPAFPQMCATHNITRSTKEIIQRELERGHQITKEIMIDGTASWRDLFVKHTFFTQGYKYYLSVIAASTTKEAHKIWSGLVESKVRLLVSGLEGHESIRLAHPFNKGFDRVHNCKNDEAIEKAKNGSLDYQVLKELLLNGSNGEVKEAVKEEVKEEVQENVKAENSDSTTETNGTMETTSVYTTTFYIGLEMAEGKFIPP
jgi:poly(A) polymerase